MRRLFVLILFAFVLASCMPVTKSPTESVPAQAAFPTNTFQPTFTPYPTLIRQPVVTLTPIPTFTPATLSSNSRSYQLKEWTAVEADLLIAQIASQLDAVAGEPIYQGVYGWSYYIENFKYLAFVENEALLRFPDVPQAKYWRWDVCYNLALSYLYPESTDAPELRCYAELIEEALNSGETNLPGLPDWFRSRETRFSLAVSSHSPPQGFTGSHIISLEHNAIFWLLEKSEKFQVTGLMSSMFFFRESGATFQQLDLTGDGYPELVLNFGRSSCCGTFTQQFIYELSSGRAELLSIEATDGIFTHLGSADDSYITSLETSTEFPGLLFEGHYDGDPITQPCNLRKYDKYYWINNQFEIVETWLGVDEPGKYDDMEFCQFVIDVAHDQGEINVAVKTIGDIRVGEPDVTREQVLYRLGEYHAQLGEVEKAKEFFDGAIQTISNNPASPWALASQAFLDNYRDKDDYYKVCSQIAQCDIRNALQQLISEIEPNDFLLAFELLKEAGIQIKSNGFIDLDSDRNDEQWLVIQPPQGNQHEFWVLVGGSEKINGLFVAEIPANQPELKQFQGSNFYELTAVSGESLISLERLGFFDQPYIFTHDSIQNNNPLVEDEYLRHDLFNTKINNIADQLFVGADPVEVRDTLTQLSQSQTFACEDSKYYCGQLYYLLGLTHELSGDKQSAVDFYLRLWNEYPDGLYTIMARSKLQLYP